MGVIKQIAFLLLVFLILGANASAVVPTINSFIISEAGRIHVNEDKPRLLIDATDANGMAFSCDGIAYTTPYIAIAATYSDFNMLDAAYGCTLGEGIKTIHIKIESSDGKYDDENSSIIYETTKPSTSHDFNGLWQAGDTNVNFSCTDPAPGMCAVVVVNATIYYSWMPSVTFSSDGNNAVSFYSIDNAGNQGDINTVYVLIDKAAPVVSNKLPLADTNKVRPTVSFDANDSGSGVGDGILFIDGNVIGPTSDECFGTGCHVAWDFDYNLANGKTINIGLQVLDNLGNSTGDVNWSFTVDLSAPVIDSITISDNGGYTSDTTPTVTLSGVSGSPSQVAFSCNGTIWKEWQGYSSSISDFSLNTSSYGCPNGISGNFDIYAKVRDAAGNESAYKGDSSYLDRSSPSTPASLGASAGNGEVSLSWSASSDNGAVDYYNIYVNGSYRTNASGISKTITGLSNGTTYYFRVSAVDKAGNEGDKSNEANAKPVSGSSGPDDNSVCSNDDSAPYLTWEFPANNGTVGVLVNDTAIVRLRVYAYDYECGLKFVKFLVDDKPIDTDTTAVSERYTVDWNSETVVDGSHVLKATAMSFNADDTENSITKTIAIKTSNGIARVYLEEPADGNRAAAETAIGSAEDSKENADALVAELASFGALPGEVAGGLISDASGLLGDAKAAFGDGNYADAKKKANDAKAKLVQAVGMLAVGDYGEAGDYVFNEEHLDIMLRNLGFSQQLIDEAKELLLGNEVSRSLSFKKVEDGDKTYYKAVITLVVKNGSEEAMTVKVVEIVPKELAASASEIAGTGYTVLVDDPVLEWAVSLGAGEEKEIVYALKGELTAEEADDMIASGKINKFSAPPVLFKAGTNVEAMFLPATTAGLFGLGGTVEIIGVAIIIGAIVVFAVLYVAGRKGRGEGNSSLDAAANRAGFGSGFFGNMGKKNESSKQKWQYRGM